MEEEISLSEFLNDINRNKIFIIPLAADKQNFFNELIKFTPKLKYNTKIITPDKKEGSDYVSFNELPMELDKGNNNYYVLFDLNLMLNYNANIFSKKNSNKILIFYGINDLLPSEKKLKLLPQFKPIYFFAKNLDLPINLNSNIRKTYISGEQYKIYSEAYLKDTQLVNNYSSDLQSAAKYLNVYFDEKIKSLESLNLDKALQRAPKFKTIMLDILTKNKKRHLVKMIDGKYGIDSFLSVYNKIQNNLPIIIIKSSDNFNSKVKNLQIFNESNAPGVILTDYNFSDNMVPKNIDYYHVTDGGRSNDLITFFDNCQAKNYSGNYPRDMNLISHISVTTGSDITLDIENNENFMNKFNRSISNYSILKNSRSTLFLKGNEFYIKIEK